MNLPNLLTLFRLFLIPFYVVVYTWGGESHIWAAVIFIVASATDVLDGYLARKWNMTTKTGQLLDPLADKCMQLAVIITLFCAGVVPGWFITLLVVKEVLMILAGVVLYSKKTYVKANLAGKLNTVFLFLVMTLLLFFPNLHNGVKNTLLGISAAMAVLAASLYVYQYFLQSWKKETGKQEKGEII